MSDTSLLSSSMPLLGICAAIWLVAIYTLRWIRLRRHERTSFELPKSSLEDAYSAIEPVSMKDWRTEEPLRLRPFKPKYHLTMGLETLSMSDLILMDKTFPTRVQIRRGYHLQHGTSVVNCNPCAIPAVNELYEWMTSIYLPKRFPEMFKLSVASHEKPSVLTNMVTGEDILTVPDADPCTTLRTLSSHVDTDFTILLPTSSKDIPPTFPGLQFHPLAYNTTTGTNVSMSPEAAPKYHLHAYAGCFPLGFSWLDKIGKPLAAIHGPVPHYGEKLEKSMDRYFATLPTRKVVSRKNWAITTNRDLFGSKGNHGDTTRDPSAEATSEEKEKVDLSETVLRCERQTLHRLPKTGALVFGFKTYQYELDDVKSEGSGPELADAVEGLNQGSVPRVRLYKKADVWGQKVCEYLRA